MVEYRSFDWMKQNATKSVPLGGPSGTPGPQVFINKGTNGRCAETLTPDEVAEYEARALRELGPECPRWLATGGEVMGRTRLRWPPSSQNYPCPFGKAVLDRGR